MKQFIDGPFRQITHENSEEVANAPDISDDSAAQEAFEQIRIELLGISNYLEALYAQIRRAAHGGHSLSLVTDDGQANDGQSFP